MLTKIAKMTILRDINAAQIQTRTLITEKGID